MAQSGQPKKLTRRQRLELIREMGAARYERFMREAERRLVECVRDAKKLPVADGRGFQGKASVTEKAVNAFVKLESLGAQYLGEELAAAKLAEMFATRPAGAAPGDEDPPRTAPIDVKASWPAFLRGDPEAVALVESWLKGQDEG